MRSKSAAPLLLLAFTSSLPAYAAQRAFVSSTGNDSNAASGCNLTLPCRSFQAAHGAVDPGGEIVALDTAGYGAVTISKSVAILSNPGVVASISVGSGNGVTIATPEVRVILRGLNINDVGTGTMGVTMSAGASLAIENCVISQFNQGVSVTTPAKVKVVNSILRGNNTGMTLANAAKADIVGSQFLGNSSGFGLSVQGGAIEEYTDVSVSDSVASENFSGFVVSHAVAVSGARLSCIRCTASNNVQNGFMVSAGADAHVHMVVTSSKASFNGLYGFSQSNLGGTSTFNSTGGNTLYGNGAGPTSGVITAEPTY